MKELLNFSPSTESLYLNLKVKTAAKTNSIKDFIIINNKLYLRISIKALPEKGKANEEIISFLAKEWRLNKKKLEIFKGQTNTLKILLIKNIDFNYLNSILKSYITTKIDLYKNF